MTAGTRRPWTLRTRLVVGVVGLFAVLSVVVGGLSVLALYNNLDARITGQLARAVATLHGPNGGAPAGGGSFNFPGFQPGSIVAASDGSSIVAQQRPGFGGQQKTLSSAVAKAIESSVSSEKPTMITIAGLGTYQFVRIDVSRIDPTVHYFYYGLPLAETQGELASFSAVLGAISLGGILVVAFATWWIVGLALRPLRRVAATATEVASMPLDRGEVDLSVRVPDSDTDRRTEVGQVGAALNSMLGHIDDALRARQASESRVRQFVADASHELRTPLASIRGYAELTRRGNYRIPKDVSHALGRVESEAVRMTSLVEDLLLLARLDAGRDLETAPVDLGPLLVDCISDAHAAGPDHEWRLDVPDEPVLVEADSQRIHQVIANLLANARVHTPAGTTVTVALARSDAAGATITVTDDGPGIPDAIRADLFERFARGDSSRSRAAGSTGLGLAIVRAVVEAHGGAVELTSEPGSTVFTVEIPGAVSTEVIPQLADLE